MIFVTICINFNFTEEKLRANFLLMAKIAEQVSSHPIDMSQLYIPDEFTLEDPEFAKSGITDILINLAFFWEILNGRQHKLGSG